MDKPTRMPMTTSTTKSSISENPERRRGDIRSVAYPGERWEGWQARSSYVRSDWCTVKAPEIRDDPPVPTSHPPFVRLLSVSSRASCFPLRGRPPAEPRAGQPTPSHDAPSPTLLPAPLVELQRPAHRVPAGASSIRRLSERRVSEYESWRS